LLASFVLILNVSAAEYKDAPLPHFDEEKDYGWMTTVPVDKPEYPHSIMKVWQIHGQRVVFMDMDKDGNCDHVSNFSKTGQKDDKGRDLYQVLRRKTCEEAETMIKRFLER